MRKPIVAASAVVALLGTACASYSPRTQNPRGIAPVYEDVRERGIASGMSVESQDIVGMTDQMMRDMLATPVLAGRTTPPRVQVDASDFENDSSERFNKQMITERLRIELIRAAQGRMVFVGRHALQSVTIEREVKRDGRVTTGSLPLAALTEGVDYKLVGKFMTHDTPGGAEGSRARYTLVSFEMVDMETAQVVWGGMYEFRKASQEHLVYR
jgi:hypothetical protein